MGSCSSILKGELCSTKDIKLSLEALDKILELAVSLVDRGEATTAKKILIAGNVDKNIQRSVLDGRFQLPLAKV